MLGGIEENKITSPTLPYNVYALFLYSLAGFHAVIANQPSIAVKTF